MKKELNSTRRHRRHAPKSREKQYRVFLSYSREDLKWVKIVVAALRRIAVPMWDRDFRYGQGFHEQIQMFIAHAHVFLPVITEKSSQRGWVHQEIGYARALNIPVLPITLGANALPDAMIQSLQAVRLEGDQRQWPQQLQRLLTLEALESVISDFADQEHAPFQCAEDTEDRARWLASYSDTVRKLGSRGLVRQLGALTSFHVPSEPTSHAAWRERYGPVNQSANHCRLLRKERLALDKHAREKGCRLIINPDLEYTRCGLPARIVRLESLVRFFKSMPPGKVQVAINKELPKERSLTIVGNWFSAESVSAAIGQGYRLTIFTRHAPSVQSKVELFDEEFNQALESNQWKREQSRNCAIRKLEELIQELKKLEKEQEAKKARQRNKKGS